MNFKVGDILQYKAIPEKARLEIVKITGEGENAVYQIKVLAGEMENQYFTISWTSLLEDIFEKVP